MDRFDKWVPANDAKCGLSSWELTVMKTRATAIPTHSQSLRNNQNAINNGSLSESYVGTSFIFTTEATFYWGMKEYEEG